MLQKILVKFSEWLTKHGSYRAIPRFENGKEIQYLDRYFIFKLGRLEVYLHRFWESDEDGVHCHPFNNFSLVLTGGYNERHHDGKVTWRKAGSIIFRTAREMHRIEVPEELKGKVWSLFIHGKRFRTWGFLQAKSFTFSEITKVPVTEGVFFPKFKGMEENDRLIPNV